MDVDSLLSREFTYANFRFASTPPFEHLKFLSPKSGREWLVEREGKRHDQNRSSPTKKLCFRWSTFFVILTYVMAISGGDREGIEKGGARMGNVKNVCASTVRRTPYCYPKTPVYKIDIKKESEQQVQTTMAAAHHHHPLSTPPRGKEKRRRQKSEVRKKQKLIMCDLWSVHFRPPPPLSSRCLFFY